MKVAQMRGREEPYRSSLWQQRATTSDGLKRLIVEMYIGGMSQRDIEDSLESALGQFVLSKRAVSERTET